MDDRTQARIMIVDDEAAQMKALCHTLSDQGYATTGFTAAAAALAGLRENKFDLVLTDLMMPEMDGIALLRAAQEIDPHLTAIIMTGEGTIATAVEAMKAGALDYILKPFKLSAILPVLSRALAVRRLRTKNAELEQRVSERSLQLEIANKDLEAFAHSISHDLRAPLRHIGGYAQMLLSEFAPQLPPEAQRLLNLLQERSRRMGQLIEDLLRFSQVNRQQLSRRTVSAAALVREVLGELGPEHPGRSIELKVAELPDCVGDAPLLKQVFVNLLANAFKFTRDRRPAVIEVGFRREKSETVYFVRDNGAGFDMANAGKLFGVFQRLHRTEEFEGTGVGLSIAHRIIERHGGRFWAEAEPDKGATFSFTLPD